MTDPNPPMDPRNGFDLRPQGSPPAAPPLLGETVLLDDTITIDERVQTSSSFLGRLTLVVAALVVAGSGVFAVTQALSEPAGPQTPDEAVEQLFSAIEDDDLIGLTEVLLPSERASLLEPMADLLAELERLELVDGSFDLESREISDVGLDFSVSGLEFTTSQVGNGVVNVDLVGGVVTVAGTVDDLPFGAWVENELSPEERQEVIDEEIVDFAADSDTAFTVVEEDGSWYVSLWYSVAEEAREEAGLAAPAFGAGVSPSGATTPEGAVRALVDRAVDLEVEGVIASLDPREFRALYDYAPLFLEDAERDLDELRAAAADEGVSWSLDRLDLARDEVRGRTVVRVVGFAFSAGSVDEAVSVDFDGDCVTTIYNQEIGQWCIDDAADQLSEAGVPEAYAQFADGYRSGMTVVERDGAWFVSGMPTVIGLYADLLAALEPQDVEDIMAFVDEAVEGAFELADPFGGGFGTNDPFIMGNEGFVIEDEAYDPFVDDGFDDFVPPTLDPASVETFLPGLELSGGSAEDAYFAFATGLTATWYTYGYSTATGGSIEIVAFDVSTDELIAAMDQADAYVRVDADDLPEGAVAYEWPEVDRVIVVDQHLVSAYYGFDANQELLIEQVAHMAGS